MAMKFNKQLIAPCGMNCGICLGYLRDKNKCKISMCPVKTT
jgi:hypothetical protein